LAYSPARDDGTGKTGEAQFRVETVFRKVDLTVRPEEWMSRDEIAVHGWASEAFDAMRAAGLNGAGVVDRIAGLVAPSPVRLDQVQGNFQFTAGRHHLPRRPRAGRREPLQHRRRDRRLLAALAGEDSHLVQPDQDPRATALRHRDAGPVRELYDHLRPLASARSKSHSSARPLADDWSSPAS
jgi:hypothetical protein